VVFGTVAAIVVIADQLTKSWIRTNLAPGEILVDTGPVRIIHTQNTGASFGIFPGHTILIITAVFLEIAIILFFIYWLHKRLSFMDNMLLRIGTGLVLGGAIGNQADRLRMGHVTDFIDFKWWPAFNVADASAVVGAIIIAYCIIFLSGLGKRKE
jgi:signal peptidase II